MENQKDNDMIMLVYPEYIEGKEIVHRKYVRDEKICPYSTKDKITIVCCPILLQRRGTRMTINV